MAQKTETSFVQYLMSNASMNYYPNNKPQDFRVKLKTPIELEGEWEAGLSAIIYPHTWNQLKAPSYLTIDFKGKAKGTEVRIGFLATAEIKRLIYVDINDLLKEINDEVNWVMYQTIYYNTSVISGYREFEAIRLHRDAPRGNPKPFNFIEFKLTAGPSLRLSVENYGENEPIALKLPKASQSARDMWRKLGVADDVEKFEFGVQARYPATIDLHFPALYVYSDLFDDVSVGDIRAPLLAVVPVRGKLGEIVYERYDKPIYVRLAEHNLTEIDIGIKDDTGDPVQFTAGKTILILHFRRRA